MHWFQFVIENENKSKRAKNRITELKVVDQIKDFDLARLKNRLTKARRCKALLEENIKKHKEFVEFLEKVVEEYPDRFQSIEDIVKEFELYVETGENLMEVYKKDFNSIQVLKQEVVSKK